ncbi:MAG: hypothetical protein JNJ78_25445 [Anaerolineae bacterium]|nr:hypothetical protein [Anaerolineae bacterium]
MRSYARLFCLHAIHNLRSVKQEISDRREQAHFDRVLLEYWDLFSEFVILEERIAGRLPAVEGIRIVKARRKNLTPTLA